MITQFKIYENKSKKEELKEILNLCSDAQQLVFKRMYSHNNLDLSINDVVDNMESSKINFAMVQVTNTLKKKINDYNL
jgi:arsenate reductase-like glutaredoxin family protein